MSILKNLLTAYRYWQQKRLKIKLAKILSNSQEEYNMGFTNELYNLYQYVTTKEEQKT